MYRYAPTTVKIATEFPGINGEPPEELMGLVRMDDNLDTSKIRDTRVYLQQLHCVVKPTDSRAYYEVTLPPCWTVKATPIVEYEHNQIYQVTMVYDQFGILVMVSILRGYDVIKPDWQAYELFIMPSDAELMGSQILWSTQNFINGQVLDLCTMWFKY